MSKRIRRRLKQPGSRWDPYRDNWGLTPKRRKFVEAFANPQSDTFLNAGRSVLNTFNAKSIRNATVMATKLKKDPRVRRAIEQIIKDDEDLESMILEGMRERLRDAKSRNWQPTADFWAKIRGAFAPEKNINVNLDSSQRDEKYQEILNKIRGLQSEKPSVISDKTEEVIDV